MRTSCCFNCLPVLRDEQVMGVVGPSSVADGLPLLHLSPYLSPPLPFSTAVVRLVALQIQVSVASILKKKSFYLPSSLLSSSLLICESVVLPHIVRL